MAGALAADTPAGGGIAVYPGNPFYNVKIYGARPGRLVRTALVGHLRRALGRCGLLVDLGPLCIEFHRADQAVLNTLAIWQRSS